MVQLCYSERFDVPDIYRYDFDANPKPWDTNRQDLEKYFNYGFTEETWRHHAHDVLSRAQLAEHLASSAEFQSALSNQLKKNNLLNFYLPHQFGGFGDPQQPGTYEF